MVSCIAVDTVFTDVDSPVGNLTLLAVDAGLCGLLWDRDLELDDNRAELGRLNRAPNHPIFVETQRQLAEYFHRSRTQFDVPLVMRGTPFQQEAWRALMQIPYGETRSYSQQAERLGNKNRVRAVANANSKNPLSILIPCHRAIGKNGQLTGFAGGLERKRLLLDLERRCYIEERLPATHLSRRNDNTV